MRFGNCESNSLICTTNLLELLNSLLELLTVDQLLMISPGKAF